MLCYVTTLSPVYVVCDAVTYTHNGIFSYVARHGTLELCSPYTATLTLTTPRVLW